MACLRTLYYLTIYELLSAGDLGDLAAREDEYVPAPRQVCHYQPAR